jgi:hypothetical protein
MATVYKGSNAVSENNHPHSWQPDFILSQADVFLMQQKERLHDVERSLLNRIDDVLPSNNHVMTLTQMAQICQCFNSMNLDLFYRIKDRISVHHECDADPAEFRAISDKVPTKETLLSAFSSFDLLGNDSQPYFECESPLTLHSLRKPHLKIDFPSTSNVQDEVEVWRARMSLSYNQNDEWHHPHVGEVKNHYPGENMDSKSYHSVPSRSHKEVENINEVIQPSIHDTFIGEDVNESNMIENQASNDDSTFSKDDDSVSLATTVKGYGYFKKQTLTQQDRSIDILSKKQSCEGDDSLFVEVTIDEANHTNRSISCNTSVWDFHHSPTKVIHTATGDESLLVTPVLARYCLEPDDSSIGVKVVPTGRHRLQHENKTKNNSHTLKKSDLLLPGLGNRRTGGKKNLFPIDEVASPVFSTRLDHEHDQLSESSNNQQEHYFPSHGNSRNSSPYHTGNRKTSHKAFHDDRLLKNNLVYAENTRLDLSERREFHSVKENFNISFSTRQAIHRKSNQYAEGFKTYVNSVTQEEYDSAPAVIKMQVGIHEVNNAIKIINQWYSASSGTRGKPQLNENVASKVFQTTPRKGKILLMSMCHWRRLNIAIDDSSGLMVFLLNDKVKTRLTF